MVASTKVLGREILVNTYTKNTQADPSIDANPANGGFQIVWESMGQDGDGLGVYGQTFNSKGNTVGGEFRLSDMTIGDQENPDIAFNKSGEGSWVWQTDAIWSPTNIDRDEVPVARDFTADNIRTRSKNFGFESDLPDEQYYNYERVRYGQNNPEDEGLDALQPRVIALGDDQFATGYYVRDYLHGQFQFTVDQYTANTDRLPTNGQWSRNYMDTPFGLLGATNFGDLAKFDDDNILVVATLASDPVGADGVIQFQLFEEPRVSGLAFDLENRTTLEDSGLTGPASDPRVTMLKKGAFAITWSELNQTGTNDHSDVYVQVFKGSLAEKTSAIKVHKASGANQDQAEVTTLKDGGFLVTWTDDSGKDGSGSSIMAQRFDANGVKLGKAVLVNETSGGDQLDSAVTTLKNGQVVVTWESETGDSSKSSIMAQKLAVGNYGSKKAQELTGTSNNEKFATGAKNDVVDGGGGNDRLDGGRGNDRLDGGDDNDILIGGGGKDKFIFNDGRDRILDFQDDIDTVYFAHSLVKGKLSVKQLAKMVEENSDSLVFDFGGGDKLTIDGISSFSDLRDDLAFI